MFKKIKGYLRRLSTPKSDINFKPIETSYGSFNVDLISSIKYKNKSNIIIKIEYDENNEDIKKDIDILKSLFDTTTRLGRLTYATDQETDLYISGGAEEYITIANIFFFNPEYAYNKPFRELYNLLMKLDIVHPYLIGENKNNSSQLEYYPYITENIQLKSDFYIHQLNDTDHNLNLLTTIIIENHFFGNIIDLISKYYNSNNNDIIFTVDDHYDEIKKILGHNFKVTNQEDYDFYKDIDEILD